MSNLYPSLLAALGLGALSAGAAGPARSFAHPDRIRYDGQCLTIEGRDTFIYSGAFHYFRCPKPLWRDRFRKIREAGFNAVETYVAWNWHEPQMPSGPDDFSKVDLTELDDWLKMAEEFGLYAIVRPGPYICAEWDTGGFPQWLMAKKPEGWKGQWLRSDNPLFLAWCKHWFDAVCPVIARHQITARAAGQPGVILVQLENEYNFANFPANVMFNQVKALGQAALANGIQVPLMTCWVQPVRGSSDPVLRQVFDTCNFYPRWDVNGIQSDIEKLRREQPDAPLMTTELQGGWFSEVGGKLSEDQEGVTAAQLNNLTLFAIQNGDTLLNYYILFGGTNPGGWAARTIATTYDYNAPIRECGGVGERYQRVWALGHMLREHGARLARAEAVECDTILPQPDVTVAMRHAQDGSRYLFVRTSQHTEAREGTARVREKTSGASEISFHYALEPFGAAVLYLPPRVTDPKQGQWLPKPAPAIERPAELPRAVRIVSARRRSDPGPGHWRTIETGQSLAQAGVYDTGFVFYQVKLSGAGETNLVVEYPAGDGALAKLDGKTVPRSGGTSSNSVFAVPSRTGTVQLLYENAGYPNFGAALEQRAGLLAARLTAGLSGELAPLALGAPGGIEARWWEPALDDSRWEKVAVASDGISAASDALLTWYRMNFELEPPRPGVWAPWRLRLNAAGNGFLYLNGHPLGRYWQTGPQHDFFLPECWLNFGAGRSNLLTLSLRPNGKGAAIQSATIEPYGELAEKR